MSPGRDTQNWAQPKPDNWNRTSFRRASLTQWMTDTKNGAGSLLARVIVNRLWQHHFGRGIVGTPNDFGFQGDRPTHPKLLDWLAQDLVEHDWKLKRMHRLMMLSSVYTQDASYDEDRAQIDRENQLLWHRATRRLEAEAIRDSMLAVSGQLDRTMYGPGTLNPNMKRRSVYFFIKRSQLIPMMMLFDWPEHLVSIGQRATTTVAPQALMFMNSPQGRAYAIAFTSKIQSDQIETSVRSAYRLAFQRTPSNEELQLATGFIDQQTVVHQSEKAAKPSHQALVDYCQALLGMNEFVYID